MEVAIVRVSTGADRKAFINLPLRLYKNCPWFVPPLYGDEKKIFTDNNPYSDTCDSVFFLAKRGKRTVGRIQGIIQHQSNAQRNEKRLRFTRFDCENDVEAAKALFDALEKWGLENSLDTVCGPLGGSDLEREGMLIEGFDMLSTFEEQYNYDYYPALVEACGYQKEIDWLEFRLKSPKVKNEMLERVANRALEINKLHLVDSEKYSKKEYINKYKDGFFHCIDECYKHLYGTVTFTESMKKDLLSQFMLIINKKYLMIICDESDNVVAVGLCLPAIGESLQKSGGKLTLPAIIRLLKAVKSPRSIDLALVAVLPQYQSSGLNAVMLDKMAKLLEEGTVEYFETNLNLETNTQVMSQWKYFDSVQHKRRRSYFKKIKAD